VSAGSITPCEIESMLEKVQSKCKYHQKEARATVARLRNSSEKNIWILQWHFICQCYQVMRFIYCSKKKSKV